MSHNTTTQHRVVSSSNKAALDISSLVLVAVLLAAGFILNMTLGNALAIVGIKPQFLIASYCLAILLIHPTLMQAVLIGILAAVVCQITTSIPFLNFLTEVVGALVMTALVSSKLSRFKFLPLCAAFLTTFVSGMLFALCGTAIMGAALASIVVKLPIVIGTSLFNALVVQALILPLTKAAQRGSYQK